MLGLLSIDVILITEHIQCVSVLAVLFAAITLLLSFGLRRVGRNWHLYSLGTAIVWTILDLTYFFVPTNIDGAYERFIYPIAISWVAVMLWLLIRRE